MKTLFMKTGQWRKRLIAAMLGAAMLLSALPASALADTVGGLFAAPAPITSSNDVYEFDGRAYKVLSNGYISAYVRVEDGAYTVLPASAAFDPDAPASFTSFRIDGVDTRFGDSVNGDEIFISPNVENGVMEAIWKTGDYVISQVFVIRENHNRNTISREPCAGTGNRKLSTLATGHFYWGGRLESAEQKRRTGLECFEETCA